MLINKRKEKVQRIANLCSKAITTPNLSCVAAVIVWISQSNSFVF
jgi:hypothetical protein